MTGGRRTERERVLALIWLVGSILTTATLLLPYPFELAETARAAVALGALAGGVALYLGPPLPDWAIHAVLVMGACVVAYCTSLGVADVEGVMFLLPVLYAFAVFPAGVAVWHLAVATGLFGLVLATAPDDHVVAPEAAFVLTMGVGAVASVSIAMLVILRDRERRHGQRDRRIAEVLQRALLPETLPEVPGVALTARYLPAFREADVGGDFYDAVELADGRIALAIGDVAGKGLPAAAVVGRARAALRAYAIEDPRPASVLDRLDDFLSGELGGPSGMVTLLYVLLDPRSGRLTWSTAGHLAPLLLSGGPPPRLLSGAAGPPLGVAAGAGHPEHTAKMSPGDRLLLFTDGLVERRDRPIDDGIERLASQLAGLPVRDAEFTLHSVLRDVPAERRDDVAILLLGLATERAPGGSRPTAAPGLLSLPSRPQ